MKLFKQIKVNADTFQKWVEASIPGLEHGWWEMFVSHSVTPSEKDDVWDIALKSAMQSTDVEVRNIIGNGDVMGCRKSGENFHCFFLGDAERVNALEEMMREVEENFTLDQWREIAEGIEVSVD